MPDISHSLPEKEIENTYRGRGYSAEAVEILLQIAELRFSVQQIKDSKFVSHDEFDAKFDPVQRIVYGMVALVLIAFVSGLIALVMLKS